MHASIPISASALTTMFSNPIPLIVSQGIGTIITCLNATLQYKSTGNNFFVNFPAPQIGPTILFTDTQQTFNYVPDAQHSFQISIAQTQNTTVAIQSATAMYMFNGVADYGNCGPIDSIAINAGNQGLGYALNDTGVITYGGNDATYIVTGVGVGGVVTGINLTAPGTSYTNALNVPTATGGAQPGVGGGLGLDTTVLTISTGNAQVDIWYSVINTVP